MKNQNGFSAAILLLTILVITAIGLTGYFVWNQQTTKNKEETSQVAGQQQAKQETKTTETPKTETKSEDTQKYLVIKEWEVKVPLQSWGYEKDNLNNDSQYDSFVLFSNQSKQLAGSSCGTDYGIGRMVRTKLTPSPNDPSRYIKIGDWYYGLHLFSQKACLDSSGKPTGSSDYYKSLNQDIEYIQNNWQVQSAN
jgi:hypothetical protein